jgi:hypothetical protein
VALTLVENTLRGISPEVFDPQRNHQHVVHLTDNRDEVGDYLDRTDDIKKRTSGDHSHVPWHLRVYKTWRMILNCLKTSLIEVFSLCNDGGFGRS